MTLPKDTVTAGHLAELEAFEDLVRSLDDDEMKVPSRCAGWTVGDVAAHVIGTMADITAGRLDGQGSEAVTARQVEERRGWTAAQLADELAGARKATVDILNLFDDAAWDAPSPGDFDGTLREAIEALWYDTYVHAEDIRAALGRPPVPGPGLEASLSHVADLLTKQGWGPATLAFDGTGRFDISGGGREITGDPLAFVLAATGRSDPAEIGLDPSVNIYAT